MQSGRANVIHEHHVHKQPTQDGSMPVSLVHTTAVSDEFKVDILDQQKTCLFTDRHIPNILP